MSSNNLQTSLVLIAGLVIASVIIISSIIFLVADMKRSSRITKRLDRAVNGQTLNFGQTSERPNSPVLNWVSTLGTVVARSGLLSSKTIEEMQATLETSGFRGGYGFGLFVGGKIILMIIFPFIVCLLFKHVLVSTIGLILKIVGGAILGLLLPEFIVNKIRRAHLERAERGVPDALDMMVICADAGLALEASINRVASEIQTLNPDLAQELTQTSLELQIGTDMRSAMTALGKRTNIESLRRLAVTLIQSTQFGTPLTQSLRSLSAELRHEALIRFEDRAGKLPTMITLPMIVFILPCVFLIVGGPAIIHILAYMHN